MIICGLTLLKVMTESSQVKCNLTGNIPQMTTGFSSHVTVKVLYDMKETEVANVVYYSHSYFTKYATSNTTHVN